MSHSALSAEAPTESVRSSGTQVLPASTDTPSRLPPPGRYGLHPDRCVAELSAGFMRLLWARLQPTVGELVVGSNAAHSYLRLELRTRPSHVGIPFSRGVFDMGGARGMTFHSEEILPGPANGLVLRGELERRDVVQELDLTGRVVHVDSESFVVHARGILPPAPRQSRDGIRLLSGRLVIEIAAEFTR